MHVLLRSVWDEPGSPHPPPPGWRDWALIGVLGPAALAEAWLRPELPYRLFALTLVIGLLPTLLWRRSRPLAAVAIAFGATGLAPLLTGGVTPDMYALAYLLLLPYALVRWGSGRQLVLGAAIVLGKVLVWATLDRPGLGSVIGAAAVLSSVGAMAAATRYRAGARLRELDRVKLLERARLARDLHDTVAHHVSAIAIRAQAGLAVAEVNPQAAPDALRVIEAEASRALAEMRAMVRVLRRDEPADLAPNPRIADLAQLAARPRTGPRVDVRLQGDLDGLPAPVDAAIYRLAQESVTNARRHARHASRIEVRVAVDDTSVRLRVSDDGESPAESSIPGYGLIGMSERAGLLGGVCQAGPAQDRGWTVTAVLPKAGA